MKHITLATAIFAALIMPASAQMVGDSAKGEKVFRKCQACHMVGEGAKNRSGPVLTGVVGRTIAGWDGYRYGKSLAALGETGAVWTEDALFEYLANPVDYLRTQLDDPKARSKMSFRLKKDQERADVIAYMKTIKQ